MKKLLHGFAALPFLAATALAQPMQLTDKQMDRATAGWTPVVDIANTNWVETRVGLPFNLTFIAAIVAEDTAFKGVTLVTLERPPTFLIASPFGPAGP